MCKLPHAFKFNYNLWFGRNIRRIIFYSIEKYSDGEVSVLSPVDAKQIAGRAGRYLSPYPHGEVTT